MRSLIVNRPSKSVPPISMKPKSVSTHEELVAAERKLGDADSVEAYNDLVSV